MKWGDRIKDIALPGIISFGIIALTVFLVDLLLLKTLSVHWMQILLIALCSSLFLSPLFLWLRIRMEQGGIEATRLTDLELNERDVREAVSNWVYIHYHKKLEGEMEFSRDAGGLLSCRVNVRDES